MTYKQRQMDVTMAEQGLKLQEEALTIQQAQLKQQWHHSKEQIELAKDKVEIEQIKLKQAQAKFAAQQITPTDLLDAESEFFRIPNRTIKKHTSESVGASQVPAISRFHHPTLQLTT